MSGVTPSDARATGGDRRPAIEARLLEATAALLDRGTTFTELSVERLVAEAGIARSTFYVYFEDKGDLVRRLTEAVGREFYEAGSAWWELAPDAGRDELAAAIRGVVEVYRRHAPLMATVVETSAYHDGVQQAYARLRRRYSEAIERDIRRGQDAGTVRPELAPRETAVILALALEHACHRLIRRVEEDVDRVAGAITDVVWHTLHAD